jgi:hypothetical protein
MAPYLAQLLTDPYSVTRQVAYRSIVSLPGFEDFEFDYLASRSELEESARECLVRWSGTGGPGMSGAHLLIGDDGTIDLDMWLRLLAQRDQRPVTIIE